MNKKVSILMLTHNAPRYVYHSVRTVRANTPREDYELVVLDNRSKLITRLILRLLKLTRNIDKLTLLDFNSLFAQGNNIAATIASKQSDYFLLLNSDIEVRDKGWLGQLIGVHKRGITAYGMVEDPLRVDGYCLLIDADIYRKYPLDEGHQWWWAITKQQATVLNKGFSVQGYMEHEQWLHHFGGKSGDAFKNAKGMNVTREEVYGWFNGKKPRILDKG